MGFPLVPEPPVLMVALQPLSQSSWAARLPDVAAGSPFWASALDAPGLAAGGLAEYAPAGTAPPPAEPSWTVRGVAGLAAGTSNSSRAWSPSSGVVDGGESAAPASRLDWDGVIDGGDGAAGTDPGGVVDGGDAP